MSTEELIRLYFGIFVASRGASTPSEFEQCWRIAESVAIYAIERSRPK